MTGLMVLDSSSIKCQLGPVLMEFECVPYRCMCWKVVLRHGVEMVATFRSGS